MKQLFRLLRSGIKKIILAQLAIRRNAIITELSEVVGIAKATDFYNRLVGIVSDTIEGV